MSNSYNLSQTISPFSNSPFLCQTFPNICNSHENQMENSLYPHQEYYHSPSPLLYCYNNDCDYCSRIARGYPHTYNNIAQQ